MVEFLAPNRSLFSLTLRMKLGLSTAVILVVACLFLGWLFIRQQARSAADGLVQSGTLLGQHLAHMGRFSIVVGDTDRLDQLIQEILAVNPVAYVAIISPNGELHTGIGKEMWQQQFVSQPTGQRQFSVTPLVRPQHLASGTHDPLVTGLWLAPDGPLLRSQIEFTTGELLSLVGGAILPIFYDIMIQVPQSLLHTSKDSALDLTFEARSDRATAHPAPQATEPTLVQIGLSTAHLQHSLGQLLCQTVIITLSTLAVGLAVVVVLARRITVPLHALTTAATKLAAGEAVPPMDIRTRDEIGTLTRVFNTMAEALQSREHELRELTHSLESRITARTEELIAANAKLKELDRRKSFFVSTASHELRTPLTSMKVHLANLRDGIDGAVTFDQQQSLLRVESNLSRLQLLIEELLDLSKIEMGQATIRLEPVTLGPMIAKTVEELHPFTSERRVTVRISLPSNLPTVPADPGKLRQILLNLLHNAVKFTPTDTIVDVTVTRISADEIRVSVRDVGPGIAPEDVDKIFYPFYRAPTVHKKTRGAGLGLTIAKLLVELHHGRLWVETTPGEGSCFYFSLQPAVPTGNLPSRQYVSITATHEA
ncbi:MAG: HAMP domain-containing histidine kinase [Nitrospira sp.]|nr:HAMP domain-containing histidine kinase [Nitrospira sp.]